MSKFARSIRGAKPRFESVELPEWPILNEDGTPATKQDGTPDCTYYMRHLSIGEIEALQKLPETNDIGACWHLLSAVLCDENGVLTLTDCGPEILQGVDPAALKAALEKANKVNGLDGAAKNS